MAYRRVPKMDEATKKDVVRDLQAQQGRMEREERLFRAQLRDALTHGFTTQELGKELGWTPSRIARWNRAA